MERFELKDHEGNVFLRAEMVEDKPWIYVQWIGAIDVIQLRKGIEQFTSVLQKTHCPYLISDRTSAEGNWFEINTWLQNIWIPKAVREGLQYVAHVLAPDFQSKLSAKDLENRLLGIKFKMFESLEEAEAWLWTIVKANNAEKD